MRDRIRRGSYDFRRIMGRRSYTAAEAAQVLGVHINTVRQWILRGLPTLDDRQPRLIMGYALKNWLKEKRTAAKRPCESDQAYCCKCRAPQKLAARTARIIIENANILRIRGRCGNCNTPVNRKGSRAKLRELAEAFGISVSHHDSLEGSDNSLVERDLEMETI